MIRLRAFEIADAAELVTWFADATELARFAGPDVVFPLDTVDLAGWLATPDLTMWSAVADDAPGRLAGHVQLRRLDAVTGRLCRVAVSPALRGRGLGRPLVGAVLDVAREAGLARVTLGVRDDNAPALRVYSSLGFRDTGEEHPGVRGMTVHLAR